MASGPLPSLTGSGKPFFDENTVEASGGFVFNGPTVQALLGETVPLASDIRDHFETSATNPSSPIASTVMGAMGDYEQNRWHLGQFELAVLEDIGYTTANADLLPVTHTKDDFYDGRSPSDATPPNGSDPIYAVADALSAQALSNLRDFDGNSFGAVDGWREIGRIDVTQDGDLEIVLTNDALGRWATLGIKADDTINFANFGAGGDTRVVGTYTDPLVVSGDVIAGSPFDSQTRFSNDLSAGNINGVLGSDDYDNDGINEMYVSLADGSAALRMLMHEDGNIRYANYQSEQDLDAYMTAAGVPTSVYDAWF